MGSNYSVAKSTVIFLGPGTPRTDFLLRTWLAIDSKALNSSMGASLGYQHQNHYAAVSMSISHTEYQDHVAEVLNRPWFTRIWVLQELILSLTPFVQCGLNQLTWDLFCNFSLAVPMTGPVADWRTPGLLLQMKEVRVKFWGLNLSSTPFMDSSLPQDDLLLNAMIYRRGLGVSDPKDMVYAHWGLASNETKDFIVVDYNKSCAEVYEDIAWYYLNKMKNVFLFFHVGEVEFNKRRAGLPSWVLDWATPLLKPDGQPLGSMPKGLGDPLDAYAHPQRWKTGSLEVWHPEPGVLAMLMLQSGTVHTVLSNTGVFESIDTVETESECLPGLKEGHTCCQCPYLRDVKLALYTRMIRILKTNIDEARAESIEVPRYEALLQCASDISNEDIKEAEIEWFTGSTESIESSQSTKGLVMDHLCDASEAHLCGDTVGILFDGRIVKLPNLSRPGDFVVQVPQGSVYMFFREIAVPTRY
jgi:hypothetical protein